MKWFFVLAALFVAVISAEEEQYCSADVREACNPNVPNNSKLENCNAHYSGFHANSTNLKYLHQYTNEQFKRSYDYLSFSINFGTYVKNRLGFEKQFRALSDKAWQNGIDLIKKMTQRGEKHDFTVPPSRRATVLTYETNEMEALATALDIEKSLATEAHAIHKHYSHFSRNYDPEITHFLDEKFIAGQAKTVRKLSGYTNDLRNLIKENERKTNDITLPVYLFDEYLMKEDLF